MELRGRGVRTAWIMAAGCFVRMVPSAKRPVARINRLRSRLCLRFPADVPIRSRVADRIVIVPYYLYTTTGCA